MVEVLRYEDFAPFTQHLFRFEGWHGELRLAQVELLRDQHIDGVQRPPFALLFAGPRGDVLPEGLYVARTEDSRAFEFYIIPVHTPAPDRQEYQAVFN